MNLKDVRNRLGTRACDLISQTVRCNVRHKSMKNNKITAQILNKHLFNQKLDKIYWPLNLLHIACQNLRIKS